jgi:thiol-disulfide isomerase/thioredoxin
MEQSPSDVILFVSKHCAPCKMMERKLEQMKDEFAFTLTTIDIEDADKAGLGDVRVAPVLRLQKSKEQVCGDVEVEDLRNILLRNLYFSV